MIPCLIKDKGTGICVAYPYDKKYIYAMLVLLAQSCEGLRGGVLGSSKAPYLAQPFPKVVLVISHNSGCDIHSD